MGLPLVVLTLMAVELLLLVRAVYLLELKKWPKTYLEAKAFLTRLDGLLSNGEVSSIHAAIEQGGPSPAYLDFLNMLRSRDIDLLGSDRLFVRHIKYYFQSEMERGRFHENAQTIDLPQIICDMPVPTLRKQENITIWTAIDAQTDLSYLWWWKPLSLGLLYISLFLYPVARFGIIAIALSCLRAMPDSAYVATWAKYIPTVE